MVRFSVFYPSADGSTFDHDYYRDTHIPMCVAGWNITAEIDRGVSGPYVAIAHLFFESMEHLQAAMALDVATTIRDDVPNYTNVTPITQISEMV